MIKSMTGFAREQYQSSFCQLQWEVRSVNHRYLDLSLRLPDNLRDLEFKLREIAQSILSRGKVECFLRYQISESNTAEMQINHNLVESLQAIQKQIKKKIKIQPAVFTDVLRWPGVLQVTEIDLDSVKIEALNLFEKTLESFIAMREREGEKLKELLLARLINIKGEVEKVRTALPNILELQKQKILERFNEAKIELDADRLAQEMLLFMQRMDVSEELDRIDTHLQETSRVLKEGGAVGRRLDFLLQEFNREANTLGSKSLSPITSHVSVELKVLIEQMREQVQNIE